MVDTHCHLNDFKAFPYANQTLDAARQLGVHGFVVVGVDLESSRRAIDLAEQHLDVFAVVGHHPNYAHEFDSGYLPVYDRLLDHPKAIAVGEIGLDFHWDYATPDQQQVVLDAFLEIASRKKMPIVFHCRKAYGALLNHLEAWRTQSDNMEIPLIFHCFSGDESDAGRALAMGGYLGVDGPITYKKADALRSLVATFPRNRVLIETDSPYMTPEPHRGAPNEPGFLPLINLKLAEIWGVSPLEAARMTTENARAAFGLPSSLF